MPVYAQLKKLLLRYFIGFRWYGIAAASIIYAGLGWLLLWLAGEQALIQHDHYFYWLVVTASTVGYGDFSPSTQAGRYIVSLYVIPFGLSIFALVVGRIAAFVSFQWRKGVRGLKHLHIENHILVIGWNDDRTLRLLKLLLREQENSPSPQAVVLCVVRHMENPLPDEIGFVRTRSFTEDSDMQRAGVSTAGCIIINNPNDDITLTTALYCHGKNPSAHTIAYFEDDSLGQLLRQHCPNVECLPSLEIEMLAKSAVDPGSSALHHQLLDAAEGMTQYSLHYPLNLEAVELKPIFMAFKERYSATLIGITHNGKESIQLNPPLDTTVKPGAIIFYIADERIHHIDWTSILSHHQSA